MYLTRLLRLVICSDGQQSSVTKDLAINVNQFETSNITYMILLIWVFGSLLCLFYMIKAFRQIDVIKSSLLESSYLNERLKVCQSKMQFYKKHITISYSSNIDNPMVFGLVKSQIVLPTVVVETMNDKEIEYIILHELSHVKSHDLIFNQLYVVFKMIFWFNPALYISKTMMDNDCEKVCDRNVLKILNRHEHIRYGESILKCSILKSQHINNVAAQYLLGFNSNIKERVKVILHFMIQCLNLIETSVLLRILYVVYRASHETAKEALGDKELRAIAHELTKQLRIT